MDGSTSPTAPIALWGGVECTVNRVEDTWHDQLARSGHDTRMADLDAFHALGLRTLRYPCLWERVKPGHGCTFDWRWTDERLGRLRELGIAPIAGLVHHGSGPPHTSIVNDSFATGLGEYAGAFAARYPWVQAYTPVNEPNTTARFSALYGHWYPHQRDDAHFCRALIVQCRAIVLAMAAIRRVNSAAQLVQTDDVGRTFRYAEAELPGGVRKHAAVARMGSVGRVSRRPPSVVALDAVQRGKRDGPRVVSPSAVPARCRGVELLPDERSISRPSLRALRAASARRQRQ